MNRFVDLSQTFEHGMPGFRMARPDGTRVAMTAEVRPYLTHEASRLLYGGRASFEITHLSFPTSIGTYLDSPLHRCPEGRDISRIALDEVIRPGVVVDVRGRQAGVAVPAAALPPKDTLRGQAVLIGFGWDCHWGSDAYHRYPYLSEEAIDALVAARPALVGVDTINIDDSRGQTRPAHSRLLAADILIVENLCNLDALFGCHSFRFFAVPWKAKGVAALPVRAFAEITEEPVSLC